MRVRQQKKEGYKAAQVSFGVMSMFIILIMDGDFTNVHTCHVLSNCTLQTYTSLYANYPSIRPL